MKIRESNVGEVLGKNRQQLRVPRFQRDFVWDADKAEDFFNDLTSAVAEQDKDFFLGTFIFSETSDDKFLDIVDGQQRITSVIIFLIACRIFAHHRKVLERNRDVKARWDKVIDKVQKLITLDDESLEMERSRLVPSPTIDRVLNQMILRTWYGEYVSAMGDKRSWKKIEKAYQFFESRFKVDKSFTDVKKIWELLLALEEVSVIEIIVSNEISAISTFERVNARGSPLKTFDLMKAFLFAEAQRRAGNADDDEFAIESDWEEIQKNTEESMIDLSRMLQQFNYSKVGYRPQEKVYKDLRRAAGIDLSHFVDELKDFSDFYRILSIPVLGGDFKTEVREYFIEKRGLAALDHEDRIDRVARALYALGLFKVVSVYPLLYASLRHLQRQLKEREFDVRKQKSEIDRWLDLLEFFEKFSFVTTRISHISALHGGKLSSLYTNYCELFTKGEVSFSKLVDECKKDFRVIVPAKSVFIEEFVQLSYSPASRKADNRIILYIFDKINRFNPNLKNKQVRPGNAASILSVDGYETHSHNIEHFLPISLRQQLIDERVVYNIGNLLAVHKDDNSKLNNKSPVEKMSILRELVSRNAIQNKGYLASFVDDYEKYSANWNEDVIHTRARRLAEVVFEITQY